MAENLANYRVIVETASTEEKICKNAITFWPITTEYLITHYTKTIYSSTAGEYNIIINDI